MTQQRIDSARKPITNSGRGLAADDKLGHTGFVLSTAILLGMSGVNDKDARNSFWYHSEVR